MTLIAKGPQTLGHETNLAWAPLWDVRARSVQLELIAPSVLYGRQFRQIAGRPLTAADQRLFAELTTGYVRARCPGDGRVPFSLGSAAQWLGHAAKARFSDTGRDRCIGFSSPPGGLVA